MQETIISCPQITINNQIISIVPNSFSYTPGKGEQSMKTQSAGGGVTTRVYSDNAESKYSTIKFKAYCTASNIEASEDWKDRRNKNVIGANDPMAGVSKTFQNAAVTKEIEYNLGADKDFDVEFQSDPVI